MEKLELTNKPICIQSSLNSFGYVAGGADTIIHRFLHKGVLHAEKATVKRTVAFSGFNRFEAHIL